MDLDSTQYNTLLAALSDMPDPRKARGKQHDWRVLLAILCGALLSGHKTVWAMAQWVREHACELIELLAPSRSRLPSASTLYRLVRTIDVGALECRLAHYAQSLQQQYDQHQQLQLARSNTQTEAKPDGLVLVGQAVDGKEVRGARSHGQVVHLVSLMRHQTGVVLGQRAVDGKSNEIKAVPHLQYLICWKGATLPAR